MSENEEVKTVCDAGVSERGALLGEMDCACGARIRGVPMACSGATVRCPYCLRIWIGIGDASHGHWREEPRR